MPSNKVFVIFCDGTGMDGVLSDPVTGEYLSGGNKDSNQSVSGKDKDKDNKQLPSNVLRLSRAIKEYDDDEKRQKRQIVYYQSGVAAFSDFEGNPNSFATLIQATGTVVASKIRDVYAFIAQNYEEGDEICLFGFSRGAYTARKVAGLIDRIGLLTRENLGKFFSIWLELLRDEKYTIPKGISRPAKIKMVVVFDTVGSVLGMDDALNINDNSFPNSVELGLHVLAIHENRDKFLPTLWAGKGDHIKQIWFAGSHSDVAGCHGDRHELGDLALYWIVGEIKDHLNIDLSFIKRIAQRSPEKWGQSQPSNSFDEQSDLVKNVIKLKTRLDIFTEDSRFHESFRDFKLTKPNDMVTLDALKTKLGELKYHPLNNFEEGMKTEWGTTAEIASDGFKEQEEDFETDHLKEIINLFSAKK